MEHTEVGHSFLPRKTPTKPYFHISRKDGIAAL